MVWVEAFEEPKVCDLGLQGRTEQDVGGLYVAVDHSLRVQVPQGLGNALRNRQPLLQVQLASLTVLSLATPRQHHAERHGAQRLGLIVRLQCQRQAFLCL